MTHERNISHQHQVSVFNPWIECIILTSLELAGEAADNALPGGMRQEVERRCDHLARDPDLLNICRKDQDPDKDNCLALPSASESWLESENKTTTDQ